MPNSQFDDIPPKPKLKTLSALAKNTQLNEERFDEARPKMEKIPESGNAKGLSKATKISEKPIQTQVKIIKKTEKPKFYVASFRLLDEDIKYIQQLAKSSRVSTRDVVKTMIDFYKENN